MKLELLLLEQGDRRFKRVKFFPNLSEVALDKTSKLLGIKLDRLDPFQQFLDQKLLIVETNLVLSNLGREFLVVLLGAESEDECIYVIDFSLYHLRIELGKLLTQFLELLF